MAVGSGIEWTEATWNPLTGCDKISPGCKHCYAERMSARLKAMGQPNYANGFDLTMHPHMVDLPLHWRQPKTIFVNSMSDMFHKDVPLPFIQRVFSVMERASWHRFQVLTKRADRLAALADELPWPRNVWMGVSIESEKYLDRADALRRVPAHVRFLSLEPLLRPAPGPRPHRPSLGDCRRRVGAVRASDAARLGDGAARRVCLEAGRLLLQTMPIRLPHHGARGPRFPASGSEAGFDALRRAA